MDDNGYRFVFGRVNYEAYRRWSEGVSLVSGEALPMWDDLGFGIKMGWEIGAMAVVRSMEEMQ